jgi:hypothetical protein
VPKPKKAASPKPPEPPEHARELQLLLVLPVVASDGQLQHIAEEVDRHVKLSVNKRARVYRLVECEAEGTYVEVGEVVRPEHPHEEGF